jgi:predicted transcriptional regulator
MKTLNRPMFRYGGPIKEGVMNGIREPKRNGGSMANNEGPRRAALVGNPIYPKGPDGRTGHYVTTLIGLGARGAGAIGSKLAARKLAQRAATSGAGTMGTGGVRGQVPTIFKPGATAGAGASSPGFLKSLFLDDPLVKLGMYGYKALTGAGAKSLGQKAVRVALSPSSIAAGIYFSNGRFFNKEGLPVDVDETGDVINTTTTKEEVVQKTPAEIEAAEAAARKKKMNSYREIMDIKGMNKDAAYKSLIDASKIIQEGGNLKEQLKDGSLITKVTAAASKNFDKVRATENALSSLLVKSKIESDLRADQGGPLMQQAKDLVAAGGAANIKEAMEYLSKKPSITQTATTFAKQFGKGFIDQDTAILAIQETFKERATPVITEKLFEEYKKADGYTTVIDLFEKLKGQKKLGEGYYVIGGNGFVIDERGNTKQVL